MLLFLGLILEFQKLSGALGTILKGGCSAAVYLRAAVASTQISKATGVFEALSARTWPCCSLDKGVSH